MPSGKLVLSGFRSRKLGVPHKQESDVPLKLVPRLDGTQREVLLLFLIHFDYRSLLIAGQ